MSRPSKDNYYFEIAAAVATRATCPRASIGAVLVRRDIILGTGFNGAAPHEPHCLERDQTLEEHLALLHCEWSLHAERNALRNAWAPADGAVLYVVGPRPVCPNCRDYLKQRGVEDIRHREAVPTLDGVLADVARWQQATFPDGTLVGATRHLQEELLELYAEPLNGVEMADVLMLMTAVARLHGIDLVAEVARKLAICRERTWAKNERGYSKAVPVS